MYRGETAQCVGGKMAEPDKTKLLSFEVELAKNGFEIRARYAPKKTLSQKKGWIPEPYCEPEKSVATSKAELIKQINALVK
jgi:hypothetical protein